MDNQNTSKSKKIYKILFYILLIISILLSVSISFNVYSRYAARKDFEVLRYEKPKVPKLTQEIPTENLDDKLTVIQIEDKSKTGMLNSLKQKNPDTIAWLEIPGTKIDYPIMQSTDNNFYLRKNFNKKYNIAGSVFADYRNSRDFKDQNTVIYGHNMKDGSMFYDVTLLKNQDFFNKYHKIYVTLDNRLLEYTIFSVYETKKDYNYREPKYDELYFETRLGEFKRKSLVASNAKVDTESNILTLSTCSYTFNDARLVVHSVLTSIVEYQ